MKRIRITVGAAAVLLAAAACSSNNTTTTSGSSASSTPSVAAANGPQTYTVGVDAKNPTTNEVFLAYFPKNVQAHGGDTVEFHYQGVGDPHTVTLGTAVDGVLKQAEALSPQQQPPPALQQADAKIPSLLPHGPGDANQVMAGPCYLASGAIPPSGSCPNSTASPFTGTESLYNSGWFDSDAKWDVRLADSISPGTYRYMCALHREGMTGRVTVLPKTQPAPSPAEQTATGQQELQSIEAKLAPAASALAMGQLGPGLKPPAGGKNVAVLAGSGSPDVQNAGVALFGPSDISVPVGGTVTWYFLGVHTVAINAPQSAKGARAPGANGTAHLNPAAVAPHGGPGEPPPSGSQQGPGNGPPRFKVVAHSTYSGSGWFSTGLFANSFPPMLEGYQVTFPTSGTYSYFCSVHDSMKGTIHVG